MEYELKDELTPLERKKALDKGLRVDRIPCTPMITDHASRFTNVNIYDYLHSPKLMAESHIEAFKNYGHDNIGLSPNLSCIAEALGSKLKYYKDIRPQVLEPIIKNYDDINNLYVLNPLKHGRINIYLEALEIIRDKIGNKVSTSTGIGGPFTISGLLRGTSNFLIDLKKNPKFAHKLLNFVSLNIMEYMKTAHSKGLACSLGEPLASNSVISPEMFREFVKPYLKVIIDFHKFLYDKSPSIHICGKTDLIWKDIADIGISKFSVDNAVNLEDLKKSIGHKLTICGNIPPVNILLNGSKSDVIISSLACIKKGFDNPRGFVLSSGCTIATDTPFTNIKAMIESARMFNIISQL